jgi:hypothetical protein
MVGVSEVPTRSSFLDEGKSLERRPVFWDGCRRDPHRVPVKKIFWFEVSMTMPNFLFEGNYEAEHFL